MELRHLRYFVAVAEELHFGRAAARLHMAQPPLSQQILQLERELGVRLLQRTKRRVGLTEPGRVFLEQARSLLRQADQAMTLARRADCGEIGRVTLGFVWTAVLSVLPLALREYRREFPAVSLTLRQVSSVNQVQALKDGRIDVGLLRSHRVDESIELTPVLREPWIAALPVRHPLALLRELPLAALADETFVALPPAQDFGAYGEFVRLCNAAGFTPQVVHEAGEPLTILGLVASGIGIALVPATTARIQFPEVAFRPVAAAMPVVELAVASRRGEDAPTALQLRRVLIEAARSTLPLQTDHVPLWEIVPAAGC